MPKDYTGMKFGMLTVIQKSNKKNSAGAYLWECKCECGKTCYVVGSKLKTRISCGCQQERISIDNYIGTKINNWFIIDKSYKTQKGWVVRCKCEKCGEIKEVNIYNILNNRSKDCGCGRKEKLSNTKRIHTVDSLSKQKFGKLTVIDEYGKDTHNKILYRCKCDCGNEVVVLGRCLLSGHTESCGCVHSKWNSKINQIVKELGFDTICEKCIMLSNEEIKWFRFDVFVPTLNLAIEYDGEGHFIPIEWSKGNGEVLLEQTKKRDKIKNEYCKKHHIHLLRIPYTERNNIETLIKNEINKITYND